MSLDETFNVVVTKTGIVNASTDELFVNCPGSLARKKYDSDASWTELIDEDRAILLPLPEADIYNIYCVTDQNNKEYRLAVNPELQTIYESKTEDVIDGSYIEYEGYIYVSPKMMICDPASFVTGETIELDTIKKSIDNNDSILCNCSTNNDGNSTVIYVFQVFDEDGETLEYRFTNNQDLAKQYGKMLSEENLEKITNDLENVKI